MEKPTEEDWKTILMITQGEGDIRSALTELYESKRYYRAAVPLLKEMFARSRQILDGGIG
jgi:hypothetical protein